MHNVKPDHLLAAAKSAATQVDPPTLDDIRRWPATVDLPKGCTAFGISRSYGYELAAQGKFPARVIEMGRTKRVVTASIVAALEVEQGTGAA